MRADPSKHAVRGFTESLRQELRGTGVPVAVVHPGGIQTNTAANARFHADNTGNRDQAEMVRRFAKLARTTPERTAQIIHSGIERGDPRIRVGADAMLMDVIVRLAPVRYYQLIEKLEALSARE